MNDKEKIEESVFTSKDPLRPMREYQAFMHKAKRENGKIIRERITDSMKDLPLPTEISEEFLGVYIHGGHKEMELEEHEPAFESFRKFSQKVYPLYFFYAGQPDHNDSAMRELCNRYAPVEMIQIDGFKDLSEYSKFMIWDLMDQIPEKYEKILTFQWDGHLKAPGWEDWINSNDPDYVGAPWWSDNSHNNVDFKDRDKWATDKKVFVGNGGFSFRKRSKMLELASTISEDEVYWHGEHPENRGNHTLEDSIISVVGFGQNIFKDIDPFTAREFSAEPFNEIEGMGFHGYV